MENALTKTFLIGARNVVGFGLAVAIAGTAAIGTLWMTGSLGKVVEQACQTTVGQYAFSAQQVLLVPVAVNAVPVGAGPIIRWVSNNQVEQAAVAAASIQDDQ